MKKLSFLLCFIMSGIEIKIYCKKGLRRVVKYDILFLVAKIENAFENKSKKVVDF